MSLLCRIDIFSDGSRPVDPRVFAIGVDLPDEIFAENIIYQPA